MKRGHKRLALLGTVSAIVIYGGWSLLSGITQPARVATAFQPQPVGAPPTMSPLPTPTATVADEAQSTRLTYAVALTEIAGLSPEAVPGTRLELWATWDRPVTRKPRLQRLVDDVILERIAPPVTPEGPPVALLSVARSELDELLWGDRYGTLSAAIVATP